MPMSVAYQELFEQGLKRCTRCKLVKPLSEFSPRSNFKGDTLPRPMCKTCCVKYVIERRDPAYHRQYRLRAEITG